MKTIEAMKDVEGLDFAVRAGLANSFRAFLRNISSEPTVVTLLDVAKSRDVALEILQRIISLSKLRVDFRYVHRFDIALATYLWVLSRTSLELARAGAEAAASLPRIWWTEQVCGYILGEWAKKPATTTRIDVSHPSGEFTSASTTNVAAVTTSILFSSSLLDFTPAKGSSEVRSSTEAASVVQHTDMNENNTPLLYTTDTAPERPVEDQ